MTGERDPDEPKLEDHGRELEELAIHAAWGRPWSDADCDRAERLVRQVAASSIARRWRVDAEAEDRRVDARGELEDGRT